MMKAEAACRLRAASRLTVGLARGTYPRTCSSSTFHPRRNLPTLELTWSAVPIIGLFTWWIASSRNLVLLTQSSESLTQIFIDSHLLAFIRLHNGLPTTR